MDKGNIGPREEEYYIRLLQLPMGEQSIRTYRQGYYQRQYLGASY